MSSKLTTLIFFFKMEAFVEIITPITKDKEAFEKKNIYCKGEKENEKHED